MYSCRETKNEGIINKASSTNNDVLYPSTNTFKEEFIREEREHEQQIWVSTIS